MSASRERKQRQASEETKISSRAQEEQKKQAQRKRNTITYSIIAIVAVILAALLLIWDTGVFTRNSAVATIDGEKVTAPQVSYYYYNNTVFRLAQMYAQFGLDDGYTFDLSESPKTQFIVAADAKEFGLPEEYIGHTFHEYFMDEALGELARVNTLCALAEKAGFTLSEEGKQTVKDDLASVDDVRDQYLAYYGANLSRTAYLQMVYGDLMNEKIYTECVERSVLASEFYTANFDTLTDFTEAELDAYYQAHVTELNTVSYYTKFFSGKPEEKKDDDGKTITPTKEEKEAAMEAAKIAAEAAKTQLEADPQQIHDDEDFINTTGIPASTTIFYDWVINSERKEGDVEIFTADNGYYVAVFEKSYLDESNTVNIRHILVSAMPKDDESTADVDESKNAPSDADYAAAKETVEGMLNEFKANNGTVEDFAALANMHSADPGSNTNGGLYEKVPNGRMIPAFNEWIFDESRQSGDLGIVKNTESATKGWHLIYFVGEDEPVWVTSARAGLWMDNLEANTEIVRLEKLDSVAG